MAAKKTILIADNEPEVGGFIAATLSRAGYKSIVTTSGREAVEVYSQKKTPITLVLIDVVMPEMDGPSLARAVRKIDPNVRVLFMSAYQRDHLERYGEELNRAELLNKPFTPVELLHAVSRAIAKSAAADQS